MASREDIEHHYDDDPEIFRAVLGPTMIYSCANWEARDDLEGAQIAKVEQILDFAGIRAETGSVLDIGCGWGGVLRLLAERLPMAKCLDGVTISATQARHATAWVARDQRVRIFHDDVFEAHRWARGPYDAAISIGAFEHLASPALHAAGTHLDRYRTFFDIVRTHVRGALGLQTIVVRRAMRDLPVEARRDLIRFLLFISKRVFPNSLIPRLEDIEAATRDRYRIERCAVGSDNYRRTLGAWRANLHARRAELPEGTFALFDRFFDVGEEQFAAERLGLAQLSLTPR